MFVPDTFLVFIRIARILKDVLGSPEGHRPFGGSRAEPWWGFGGNAPVEPDAYGAEPPEGRLVLMGQRPRVFRFIRPVG
jgi:hypothetical protein